MVTTPDGSLVAMVHCNNCTSDLNAWVNLFKEYQELLGVPVDMNEVFGKLYTHALEGDADCGGLISYNYISGEPVTKLSEGRPMVVRSANDKFNRWLYVLLMISLTLLTLCVPICMLRLLY